MRKKNKIVFLPIGLAIILILILMVNSAKNATVLNKVTDAVLTNSIANNRKKEKKNQNSIFTSKIQENVTQINFYDSDVITLEDIDEMTDIYNLLNSMTLEKFVQDDIIKGGLSMDIYTDELAFDIGLYSDKAFINGRWYRTDQDYYKIMLEKLETYKKE